MAGSNTCHGDKDEEEDEEEEEQKEKVVRGDKEKEQGKADIRGTKSTREERGAHYREGEWIISK